jgi:hypothetical protein
MLLNSFSKTLFFSILQLYVLLLQPNNYRHYQRLLKIISNPESRFSPTAKIIDNRAAASILADRTMVKSTLSRPIVLGAAFFAVIVSACGKTPPTTTEVAPPPPSAAISADHPLNKAPGIVRGRIVGAETGIVWSAGVMEFRAEDPEIRMVAAEPIKPDRTFEITLPPLSYDIPFAVIAFHDENNNRTLDRGEDFIGGKSRGPGYEGSNLFLFTEGGTFVGDRSWDLAEITFEIDVALR